MENDKTRPGGRLIRRGESLGASGRAVDPAEVVTSLGFLFGAAGAVIGAVSALFVSPLGWISILYCVLSAFAGGSAGIVTGGMIGAILAVARGVTARPGTPETSTAALDAEVSTLEP